MVYGTAKIKGAFDRGDYYSVAEYAVGIAGGIAAVLAFFTGGTSAVLAGAAAGLSMTGLAFAIGQVFREDPTIMGQADVSGKTLMELSKMMNDTVIDSNMSNSVKVKVLGGLRDELVKRKVNTPEGYKLLDEIQKKT